MSEFFVEDATALVEPMATGVTGQDDAYKIFVDENSYTKCFDKDKNSVKGHEESLEEIWGLKWAL